jgi:hypothetical protein
MMQTTSNLISLQAVRAKIDLEPDHFAHDLL